MRLQTGSTSLAGLYFWSVTSVECRLSALSLSHLVYPLYQSDKEGFAMKSLSLWGHRGRSWFENLLQVRGQEGTERNFNTWRAGLKASEQPALCCGICLMPHTSSHCQCSRAPFSWNTPEARGVRGGRWWEGRKKELSSECPWLQGLDNIQSIQILSLLVQTLCLGSNCSKRLGWQMGQLASTRYHFLWWSWFQSST